MTSSSSPDAQLARLVAAAIGGEPTNVPGYFAPIYGGPGYNAGSVGQAIGVPLTSRGSFLVPQSAMQDSFRYFGVYLVADDYMAGNDVGFDSEALAELRIQLFMSQVPRDDLLLGLAFLTLAHQDQTNVARLVIGLRESLTPPLQLRLDSALARRPTPVPLVRQALLAAFRMALLEDEPAVPLRQLPPEIAAFMLTHSVASTLGTQHSEHPRLLGGVSEDLAIDIVCNQAFNESDDIYSVIDRHVRLWRDFGPVGAAKLGGQLPAHLVKAATGIELEDFLALGFSLFSFMNSWTWGGPQKLAEDFSSDMDPRIRAIFLDYVAATQEELQPRLATQRSHWDFLAFQEAPVLRVGDGLMVIDQDFLLARVTSGIYWIVHDWLKKYRGDGARQSWTQAWGDMVEALAEESIRVLAPPILGGGSGGTYFTEDDLALAYPGHKTCDAVIDFGTCFVAFEIVSGQLSTGTRIDGDLDAFERDMERLAYKKIRQLDDSATCIATNETPLTGVNGNRTVIPIVVAGGGFPVSSITSTCIQEYCEAHGLIHGERIRPVVVIDLGELEAIEALSKEGVGLPTILTDWQASDIASSPLHNFLLEQYSWSPDRYRPDRMRPHVEAVFRDLVTRLRFRSERPTQYQGHVKLVRRLNRHLSKSLTRALID